MVELLRGLTAAVTAAVGLVEATDRVQKARRPRAVVLLAAIGCSVVLGRSLIQSAKFNEVETSPAPAAVVESLGALEQMVAELANTHTLRIGTGSSPSGLPDWSSSFAHATGNGDAALFDGASAGTQKWQGTTCDRNADNSPERNNRDVFSVEANGAALGFPSGVTNVSRWEFYEVTNGNPTPCLMVRAEEQWALPAVGESVVDRHYVYLDLDAGESFTPSGGSSHYWQYGDGSASPTYDAWLTFVASVSVGDTITLQLLVDVNQTGGSVWQWTGFPVKEVVRIEIRRYRSATDSAKIDIQIYNAAGTLIADSGDFAFSHGDVGSGTLQSFSPTIAVETGAGQARFWRNIEVGNNGPENQGQTLGRYLYVSGVAFSTVADSAARIGPYQSGEGS